MKIDYDQEQHLAERYGVSREYQDDYSLESQKRKARTQGVPMMGSGMVFAGVAESLPSDLAVVRLYENYLATFAINQGRAT